MTSSRLFSEIRPWPNSVSGLRPPGPPASVLPRRWVSLVAPPTTRDGAPTITAGRETTTPPDLPAADGWATGRLALRDAGTAGARGVAAGGGGVKVTVGTFSE